MSGLAAKCQASVPEPGPGAVRLAAPPREGLPPNVDDTIAAAASAFSITERVQLAEMSSAHHCRPRATLCAPAAASSFLHWPGLRLMADRRSVCHRPDTGIWPCRRPRAKGRRPPLGRASSAVAVTSSISKQIWALKWRLWALLRQLKTSGHCLGAAMQGGCPAIEREPGHRMPQMSSQVHSQYAQVSLSWC
jgi:hypothetical protein